MCFSAEASFLGAAVLGIIGYCNLRIASHRLLLLAMVPLIFACQQFVEGVLWLSHSHPTWFPVVASVEKYFFLSIAIFLWPIWIPLSLLAAEKVKWRKVVLTLFLISGILYDLSIARLSILYFDQGVDLVIQSNRIQYQLPMSSIHYLYAYATVTALPPFFSGLRLIWVFAVMNMIGFFVAYSIYEFALVSVWCFFAAWVSLGIYLVLRADRSEKA
jgi:hypothetical protein